MTHGDGARNRRPPTPSTLQQTHENETLAMSTGVIGENLPILKIIAGNLCVAPCRISRLQGVDHIRCQSCEAGREGWGGDEVCLHLCKGGCYPFSCLFVELNFYFSIKRTNIQRCTSRGLAHFNLCSSEGSLYSEDAKFTSLSGSPSSPALVIDPSRVGVMFVPSDNTAPLPVLINSEPEKVDEVHAKQMLGLED